jgi:signal transduction histidine kinase
VRMCVRDDGRWKPGDPVVPGFGMKGMLERVAAAGGTLTFTPVSPHGLEVCCTVPMFTQQGSD